VQAKRVGGQQQNREGEGPERPSQLSKETDWHGTGKQTQDADQERGEQGGRPATQETLGLAGDLTPQGAVTAQAG